MKLTTRGHRHRCQDERGSGGLSLSWVLLTPVLLALIFGGIAMAFRMYGENLALDAANAGARAAAVLPLSADRGWLAAQEFLKQDANGTLTDTSVPVELSGQNVVVSVNRAHPDSALHGVTAVLMDGGGGGGGAQQMSGSGRKRAYSRRGQRPDPIEGQCGNVVEQFRGGVVGEEGPIDQRLQLN